MSAHGSLAAQREAYDALRAAVLEYAPVALNVIVEHFGAFVENARQVHELGLLALNSVLANPLDEVPVALTPELGEAITTLAVEVGPADPGAVSDVVHTGFVLAGEFAVRRGLAAGVDPDLVCSFADVLRAFERLVQELVARVGGETRARMDGLERYVEATALSALLRDPQIEHAAADELMDSGEDRSSVVVPGLPGWLHSAATITPLLIRYTAEVPLPRPADLPRPSLNAVGSTETVVVIPSDTVETMLPVLMHLFAGGATAVGIPVAPEHLRLSVGWCRRALRLRDRARPDAGDATDVVRCAEIADVLIAGADTALVKTVADQILAPVRMLTDYRRDMLLETLGAWVRRPDAGVPTVAALLGRHPQTIRYRMRKLHAVLGEAMSDQRKIACLRQAFLLELV